MRFRAKDKDGVLLVEINLTDFPATIGRKASASITIRNSNVSSKHAELNWDGKLLTVTDLSSSNGTYFDNERITKKSVTLPCTFVLGGTVVVEIDASSAAKTILTKPGSQDNIAAGKSVPLDKIAAGKPVPLGKIAAGKPVPPGKIAAGKPVPPGKNIAVKTPLKAKTAAAKSVPPVSTSTKGALENSEAIDAWDQYWHLLRKMSVRNYGNTMVGLMCGFFLLNSLLIPKASLNLEDALVIIGVLVMAAPLAALLALPGLFIRRKYEFKPVFFQTSFTLMLGSIYLIVLRPGFLVEDTGVICQVLSFLVLLVAFVGTAYVFLFSTIAYHAGSKLGLFSVVFGLIICLGQAENLISVDKQHLMHSAMFGELFHETRSLAGKPVEVNAVAEEIRSFGKRFPTP